MKTRQESLEQIARAAFMRYHPEAKWRQKTKWGQRLSNLVVTHAERWPEDFQTNGVRGWTMQEGIEPPAEAS